MIFNKSVWKIVFGVFVKIFAILIIIACLAFGGMNIYNFGYYAGYTEGQDESDEYYENLLSKLGYEITDEISDNPVVDTPKEVVKVITPTKTDWGGPELWEAVNKRRIEFGVNPLSSRDELCTIASIRLNELLVLGTLDNHEGFSSLTERRTDLQWIFDKYSTVAEFLALGGQTADETVNMWENTLGHKKLLTGGEYVWGCIYAQDTTAVAITAF